MDFSQVELNAIAFEIMRQEVTQDMHAPIVEITAKRLREDYLISEESAKIAAQSAMVRWSDIYFPD
jgi:hypothetical protein